MGAELVRALLTSRAAAGLSAKAVHVGALMAVTALDTARGGTPAGRYWGGRLRLAQALGYAELTPPAEEKIRRAIKELREAGVIEPLEQHAHRGTAQGYRFLLSITAATECPTGLEGHRSGGALRESPTDPVGKPLQIGGKSPTDLEGPRSSEEQEEQAGAVALGRERRQAAAQLVERLGVGERDATDCVEWLTEHQGVERPAAYVRKLEDLDDVERYAGRLRTSAAEQREAAALEARKCPHGQVDGREIRGRGEAASRICGLCDADSPATHVDDVDVDQVVPATVAEVRA